MQQNQLLLGTFLNFLQVLLIKRINANIKNVAVFIFLHNAMIWSFLVHFQQAYNIFVHRRPKSTQHAKKIARFFFLGEYKWVVDEYKGVVTLSESPILSSFHSCYPITLFEWHITHLSPHRPPSEAQINSPKIARFPSVDILMTGLWIPNLQRSMSLFKTSTFQMMSWKTQIRWWRILLNHLQKTKSKENSSLYALFRNSIVTTPTFVKKRYSQWKTKSLQITKWRPKIADWSLDYLTVLNELL